MPRPGHENTHIQRKLPCKPRIKVGDTHSLENPKILRQMPAHYLTALQNNPNLKPCCRDTTQNYTYETFKTDEDQKQANLAVFTCTVCGCKHHRGAASPGGM